MLQYKDVQTLKKRNLCYLCDEQGKKVVNIGFDEVYIAPNHTVFYKIDKKCNIVTEDYFLSHPKRSEVISNCKYSKSFQYDNFRVLVQDFANGIGLKIVESNGKITTIDNAVLVGNGSRYIVYRVYGTYCYQAIYSSSQGVKHYTIPELKTENKGIFDLEEFFNECADEVESKEDLTELINFYRYILLEDIRDFNKASQKYILVKNPPQVFKWEDMKPFKEYRIDNRNLCFKSAEEAKENATKIIKTLRKMILDRLNKQESEKLKVDEEIVMQEGLIQKACEAFKKSTKFKN